MDATQSKSQSTPKKRRKTAKSTEKAAQREPKGTPVTEAKPAKRPGKMFTPTNDQRQIVMLASAVGLTEDRIAELIINPENSRHISETTLRTKFRHELKHGHELVLMRIAGTMVSIATDKAHKGCVTAGIYLTKVLGKWREPEPEWSEKKRTEQEGREKAGTGWTIIDARPVLEEPKQLEELPAPPTVQ